jgi:hypothetical protein
MFENVRKLSSVLKNIPGDIKPRQNQTEKVEIGIYMALNSMQDYDEVSIFLIIIFGIHVFCIGSCIESRPLYSVVFQFRISSLQYKVKEAGLPRM